MNAVLKLVLIALTAYSVGTLVGPVAIGAVNEAKETLSPFLVISVAILIGSIGYAVGAVRRSPFVPEYPEYERDRERYR
ncbi:hypothetical protein [Ruficoccus sp. ZRK36]|uniref:hypothetical protein n=1 Tax=Ruficoccus sp. ZRK36 TaxID=2866311 RepID=UPI001C72B0ED|nr:hypothetical protein [Ruficoccus sp. ZRK36]QYY36718.1 hypothetical protein K0V07_04400 [Ruficoccus sp. ZRK36]